MLNLKPMRPMNTSIPSSLAPFPKLWSSALRSSASLARLCLGFVIRPLSAAVSPETVLPLASTGRSVPLLPIARDLRLDVAALVVERQGGDDLNPIGATSVSRLQLQCRCRTLLGG